jgi:hypothetical protein
MFVSDEVRVELSFAVASQRLATLAGSSSLICASHAAWGDGLARVGPSGPVPGLSKLVRVQFRDPVQRDGVATLTLRWQATGPMGGLFPVLDADVRLSPVGEQATLLGLDGVYGPPGGLVGAGLDRAILHRIAAGTVRAFLSRLGAALAEPAPGMATGSAAGCAGSRQ